MAAQESETLSPEKLREETAYALGTAAFLWGFTMNELYRVRSHSLSKPGNAVNKFDHARALMTPELAKAGGVVSEDYPPRDNEFNGKVNWVQIDVDAAAKDVDHKIGAEERFMVAVARQ